jgi:hypothetical protein
MNSEQRERLQALIWREFDVSLVLEEVAFAHGSSSSVWRLLENGGTPSKWCARVSKSSLRGQSPEREIAWRERLGRVLGSGRYGAISIPANLASHRGQWTVELSEDALLSIEEFIASEEQSRFPLPSVLSAEHVASAAQALGAIHCAGIEACEGAPVLPTAQGFSEELIRAALRARPGSLEDSFSLAWKRWSALALPWVMVHGDFHPGNCAFRARKCTGVFDFEYARADTRILDVAYGVLFFACSFRGESIQYNPDLGATFLEHYRSATRTICPVNDQEQQGLPLALEICMWGCLAWTVTLEGTNEALAPLKPLETLLAKGLPWSFSQW